MSDGLIIVDWLDVLIGLGLVAIAIGISYFNGFGLERDLTIGVIRTVLQLTFLGFALKYIFEINAIWITALILITMAFIAALTAKGRIKKPYPGATMILWISIAAGSFFALAYISVLTMTDSEGLSLTPRYLIPLGGMAIGNTLNGVTLAGERFRSELESKRDRIEVLLSLGADSTRASADCVRSAITAAAIPMINALMVIGLITIPGIMTGIVLSGKEPLTAASYQMLIMFMIVAGKTIAMTICLKLSMKSYFTADHQLRRELL